MIRIENITLRIAGRALLHGASAQLPDKAKIGLVGPNGSGKTTLFRAICGEIGAETGEILVTNGLRIGQVAQEAPGTDESLLEIVLAADRERAALLKESETEADPNRIAEIHMRLGDIDAHSGEARAGAILAGLGFSPAAQVRPASSFSGGWRMRVALAALLFSRPDILLLDEPTNYLDLEGTMWLEQFVARYPGSVLIISHDRDLLNASVDSILHLDDRKLVLYRGNYDSFARQRAEKAELARKAAQKQAARARHLQSFVDRFRYKASKARQAQSRLKMLEKMPPIALLDEKSGAAITLPDPEQLLASPIITMDKVSVGYGESQPVLQNLTLRIDQDDRIALLGANGNGKSTFAKLLAGRLDPMEGRIVTAPTLRTAIFAQHQLEDLTPDATAVEHLRARKKVEGEAKLRAMVASMGLDHERMDTPARNLSGGEKARLLLGLATIDQPHLLILDEPTNHLDMDARESLMMALNQYAGAVILISHDRHLIEACADRLWLVENAGVTDFPGDLAAYRAQVLSGNRDEGKSATANARNGERSAAARRRDSAERRRLLAPLQQKIREAELEMEKLRRAMARIDDKLADPSLFQTDSEKGAELAKMRAQAETRMLRLEESWLEMSQEYESKV